MSFPLVPLPNAWLDSVLTDSADMGDRITTPLNTLALFLPKLASGKVLITPSGANTPTSVAVQFPNGLFNQIPALVVTAETNTPGAAVANASATAVSSTGATIWLTRAAVVATYVDWIALQNPLSIAPRWIDIQNTWGQDTHIWTDYYLPL